MPYEIWWDDAAHSILLIDAYDEITWQGYRAIHEKICEELEQSPHRVDVIYDDSKVGFPGGNIIIHLNYVLRRLRACSAPGKIYFILISDQSFVKAIVERVAKAHQIDCSQRVSFVSSIQEAFTLIKYDRSGIGVD